MLHQDHNIGSKLILDCGKKCLFLCQQKHNNCNKEKKDSFVTNMLLVVIYNRLYRFYSKGLIKLSEFIHSYKYDWLKPGDYSSWETLKKAIDEILRSVGDELKIDFGELIHYKNYKEQKNAAFI